MGNAKQFYVYLYLDEQLVPYYVGKGSGSRITESHRPGLPIPPRDRIQIIPCPSEKVALAYEILLISTYGRKDLGTGILENRNGGGHDVSHTNTAAARAKKIASNRRRRYSAATLRKMSESAKAQRATLPLEERKRRVAAANQACRGVFGNKMSEADRKKTSEAIAASNRRRTGSKNKKRKV